MVSKYGGGKKCARCNKPVYAVEKVSAASLVSNLYKCFLYKK